jgi:hypothetical protein
MAISRLRKPGIRQNHALGGPRHDAHGPRISNRAVELLRQHLGDASQMSLITRIHVVLFVDVLHHSKDPMILLREAVRMVRKAIVIKDHTLAGLLAG